MKKICSITGCNKKSFARTWCTAHWSRWRRHGSPNYIRAFKKDLKCEAIGCERNQKRKGYCATHAMKLSRTGTLEKIRDTKEYKEQWLKARLTPLSKIDGIRESDPNRRGFYAIRVISGLRQRARQRGIDWSLESIDAYNLIKSPCHYCGFVPQWPESRCGLDRIDNFKGYIKDNVTSCCYTCNTAKGIKSKAEFLEWVISIFNHFPRD